MTKQEYIKLLEDTSWNGGFPAVVEASSDDSGFPKCRYRTPDGKKCVAGLLIPDEKYEPFLEGRSAGSEVVRGRIDMPEGVTFDQLNALQTLHDTFAELPVWPAAQFNVLLMAILQ